jgi:hypothetical protein
MFSQLYNNNYRAQAVSKSISARNYIAAVNGLGKLGSNATRSKRSNASTLLAWATCNLVSIVVLVWIASKLIELF